MRARSAGFRPFLVVLVLLLSRSWVTRSAALESSSPKYFRLRIGKPCPPAHVLDTGLGSASRSVRWLSALSGFGERAASSVATRGHVRPGVQPWIDCGVWDTCSISRDPFTRDRPVDASIRLRHEHSDSEHSSDRLQADKSCGSDLARDHSDGETTSSCVGLL